MDVGYQLNLDLPFGKCRFYSEHQITESELSNLILEAINECENIRQDQFNPDALTIQINEHKAVHFSFEDKDDVRDPDRHRRASVSLKKGIETIIFLDVEKSAIGSRFCVKLLKKLQKKYPNSCFAFWTRPMLFGNEISNITINEDILGDPELIPFLEESDDYP